MPATMSALGVGGTLADPKIEFFAGAIKTGENDNWGGSAALANAMATVGAFAYAGPNSRDAAATLTVGRGDNSVRISAADNGTGTTLAGLSSQLSAPRQLLGIAALKNAGFLNQDIARLLTQFPHHPRNWQLLLDYHCGGFAKTTPALIRFINAFEQRHQLALEPVYTGKLLAAVYDLIEQDFFQPGWAGGR